MTKQHSACKFEVDSKTGVDTGISFYPFAEKPFYCRKTTDFLGCPTNYCWTRQFDGWTVERTSQQTTYSVHLIRGAHRQAAGTWKEPPLKLPSGQDADVLGQPGSGGSKTERIPMYIDAAGVVSFKGAIYNMVFKDNDVILFGDEPYAGSRDGQHLNFSTTFPDTTFSGNIDTFWFNKVTNEMLIFKGSAFHIFAPPSSGDLSQPWKASGSEKYIGNYFKGFPKDLDAVYFYDQAYFIAEHWYYKVPIDSAWSTLNKDVSYTAENMHTYQLYNGTFFAGFYTDECYYLSDDVDIEIRDITSTYKVSPLPPRKNITSSNTDGQSSNMTTAIELDPPTTETSSTTQLLKNVNSSKYSTYLFITFIIAFLLAAGIAVCYACLAVKQQPTTVGHRVSNLPEAEEDPEVQGSTDIDNPSVPKKVSSEEPSAPEVENPEQVLAVPETTSIDVPPETNM
ncbi:hypothetical protein HDE_04580 [Halotydeus destructor]|nr:hypothetical protein HDE_04580 [Halotydeus destructor]